MQSSVEMAVGVCGRMSSVPLTQLLVACCWEAFSVPEEINMKKGGKKAADPVDTFFF